MTNEDVRLNLVRLGMSQRDFLKLIGVKVINPNKYFGRNPKPLMRSARLILEFFTPEQARQAMKWRPPGDEVQPRRHRRRAVPLQMDASGEPASAGPRLYSLAEAAVLLFPDERGEAS